MLSRSPLPALLLASSLLLSLVGCGRTDDGKEVRLGYFANLTHAQAVLGVASGDFERALGPAKLTARVFNAGPSLIEALFAGEIDVAYVGPGPVLSANERTGGRGLRVIAGAAANGVVIVARKDSGIASLKDLAGKHLATPQQGNTQDISARHYLQAELKASDLNNVIPIDNAEQAALMDRGQIDAAWVPEPWGARLIAQSGARLIAEEKDLWPNHQFALTVVITTPEFLASHPDLVRRLLQVHHEWTRRLQEDPARYVAQLDDALFALTQKRLPAEVTAAALKRVEFTDQPLTQTFERMGDWSYELGFLRQPPRLDRLVDTTLLQQVTASPATTRAID